MAFTYGDISKCKNNSGSILNAYECRVGYQINSQSIQNNTSNVTLRLEVRSTSSSYGTYGYKQTSVIDGSTLSTQTFDMRSTNTWQVFGERTITISHNSDGSYSATKSASFSTTASGSYSLGKGSASVTLNLTTIPRASEPSLSASSITLGANVTINIDRKSSSFTHIVKYKFGNANGTIASSVSTSTTWAPTLSLANQVPNSTSGTCIITCETYNGSTLIGAKTVNLTLTVPSSVVPSISSVTLSEANTSVPSNWGCYVQNKSKLKVVTSASGSYGSSIKSYKITGIDNNTYTSNDFISNVLTQAGTKTITVAVTDSRGRTATKTVNYTCVAYSNPIISTTSAVRCNSNGTANEEGTSIKYTFKATVSSVNNKNVHTFKIGYKKTTDSSYTYVTIANDSYTLNKVDVILSGVTFSENNSYDFQFYAGDYFTSTAQIKEIATGFTLIDYNASGKAMAFGKVSEAGGNEKLLEVALPTDFQDTTKIKGIELFLKIYPVGSIYMSVNSTNPATLFGGTWEQLKDRFLIGAGNSYAVNAKGGATSVNSGQASGNTGSTVLQQSNLPSRTTVCTKVTMSNSSIKQTTSCNNEYSFHCLADSGETNSQGHTHTLNSHAHTVSIMPPYLAVYMWKRLS